ncbi:MAG: TIGR01459 family HAD-type hydrolase [Rhodobacterales bacterium]|nr:MAG: TIGR01459 family HAD-type hydrolase [Rhodobacterales bacterium]
MTRIIEKLADVSANYDLLLCDLWGCVHDGIRPFPDAVAALQHYRAGGGTVVLVTNAPRHRTAVAAQLDKMGLPRDTWDLLVTSGDSARAAMFTGAVGEKVYFMGQPHDESFFDPMEVIDNPVAITRVPLSEAEGIVCCGPLNPRAPVEDSRPDLLFAKQKGLKLLCANPDLMVDRGEAREWCAGAVAAEYTKMGGESLYFGKPHPPIYDLARRLLAAQGKDFDPARTLALGDGIHTDIAGAIGEDIDSLFITGGLARAETGTKIQPDPDLLRAFTENQQIVPTLVIGMLR